MAETFWANWQLWLWLKDDKATRVNTSPIVDLQHVELGEGTNAPYEYTINCQLADPRAVNISKGHYFEVWRGTDPSHATDSYTGDPRQMYIRGYVQNVHKMGDAGMDLQLTCSSPSWDLMVKRSLGALIMKHAWGYNNILDVANGLPDGSGGFPPKHKGILRPGSGWTLEWLDGPGSSVAPGRYDASGKTWFDEWRSDWNAKYLDMLALGSIYNFSIREKRGHLSTARAGIFEGGPLMDDHGFTIHGGRALLNLQISDYGYPADATAPNIALAQESGLAAIDTVEYTDNLEQIRNLIWINGHGHPEEDGTTLRSFSHGIPINSSGATQNGWTLLGTPPRDAYDENIYYRTASRTTYDGHSFVLVAAEQQDDADGNHRGWAYGVADTTSMTTYGLREDFLERSDIKDSFLLLAAALGKLRQLSREGPSFTFTVKHPLLIANNGFPNRPAPGEKITIDYIGAVKGLDRNEFDFGSTGDWTVFLDFPGVTDPEAAQRLLMVSEVHEVWDGEEHTQTITTGYGKKKTKALNEALASQMVQHLKHPRHQRDAFKHRNLDGTRFVMTPGAWVDESAEALVIPHGEIVASDVQWSTFFADRTGITFDIDVTDEHAWLDFDFAVDYEHQSGSDLDIALLDPASSRPYGTIRIAFGDGDTNSGMETHFYTSQDGTVFTPRGHIETNSSLDAGNRLLPGSYRLHFRLEGGRFEASIQGRDTDVNDTTERWDTVLVWNDAQDDANTPNSRVIGTWGAIRWRYNGGDAQCSISRLHVHPETHFQVKRPHLAPGIHHTGWNDIDFWVVGYDNTHTPNRVTVERRIYGSSGGLYNHFGRPIHTEGPAAEVASWSDNADFSVQVGSMLVWNGSGKPIDRDIGGTIGVNEFGGVTNWEHLKPTQSKIIHIGRVMIQRDRHTRYGVIQGWSYNVLQTHGRNIAPGAVGQRGLNQNVHTSFSYHNMTLKVRKGTSLDTHGHPLGQCTARLTLDNWKHGESGSIKTHDGVLIGTMSNSQQYIDLNGMLAGNLLLFNRPTDANGIPTSNVITPSTIIQSPEVGLVNGKPLLSEENAHVIILGKLSDHPDKHTHSYFFHHWNPTGHHKTGKSHQPKSVGRGAGHPALPHKKRRKLPTGAAALSSVLLHNP